MHALTLLSLALCITLLLLPIASASPEDPHLPRCWPSLSAPASHIRAKLLGTKNDARCSWFEGWYTRVFDPSQNCSIVVIVAQTEDGDGQVTLIFGRSGERPEVAAVLTKDASLTSHGGKVTHDPDPEAPADFAWSSPTVGELVVKEGLTELDLHLPNCSLTATLTQQTSWHYGQRGAGPEGWASSLPPWLVHFLGVTRWYIHSLSSRAQYVLHNATDGTTIAGEGWAHEEKNWGPGFPKKHIWAEAISPDNVTQLVFAAAWFDIAGVPLPPVIALAYRTHDLQLDIRSNDPGTTFSGLRVDPCSGIFEVTVSNLRHSIQLRVEASRSTFTTPILSPTGDGDWKPGCEESYSATAEVLVSEGLPFKRRPDIRHSITLQQVALEFGEGWLCSEGFGDSQAQDRRPSDPEAEAGNLKVQLRDEEL